MRSSRWLQVFIYALALPAMARAQTAGSISGRVYDPSNAVIAGAVITAVNAGTGEIRGTTTDQNGYYVFPVLPVGVYDVSAGAQSFKRQIRKAVTISVAARLDIDFTLSIGLTTQTVEVVAGIPVMERSSAVTGGVMQNRELMELPINGRDYARFSMLIPGAALARSNYIGDLTFNGQHGGNNQFSIDGVDATRVDHSFMANGFERGARLLTGSIDTISEFRVQTNSYDAQFGRSAGTQINIVSKSGTNLLHGTAFDFFRNDILDAKNFFATDKPEFRFNDFGANIGGPVLHDRTFFFLNYEGSRQRIGITGTGTVPSTLMRNRALATSPAVKPILDNFPLGASPTSDPLVDNYSTSSVLRVREDTSSIRVDHNFSAKNSAFARVNINDSHVAGPVFGMDPSAMGVNDSQNVPVRTSNIAISDTHVFNPHSVNQVLIGVQRYTSRQISNAQIPRTSVTGLTVRPGFTEDWSLVNNTGFQAGDNMAWVHGRHTLKYGGTVYRIRVNMGMRTSLTQTYTSLDDFINNRLASADVSVGYPTYGTRATELGLYIQDTFQAARGITLDYGLRYDVATPPHDANANTRTFDTRTNKLAAPGTPYFKTNMKNFAPRFGFAWSPMSSLVVRGGFGIFFQAYPVGSTWNLPKNTITGNTNLSQQTIPDLSYPFERFLVQGSAPLPSVSGFSWEKPDAYSNQWNLSFGYEVTPSTGIQLAYVGNHTLNLARNLNINFFDPLPGKRPIDAFADVNVETATGQNIYHSAQLSLIRAFSGGFQSKIEYVFAHGIDDVQDAGMWPTQPQDNRNRKAERGNSSNDTRHSLAFNTVYDLPFGKGRHFGASASNLVERVLGGWRVASLGLIRTGVANTVYIGTNTYGDGNLYNQRPDWKGGGPVYPEHQTVDNFLNSAVYEMPALGTFGDLGRNTVHGPGFTQIDISFLKAFGLAEGKTLEYRCEIFNFPNHPNFDQPNTDFGTEVFGKIFNTLGRTIGIGTSRQIQMALKLVF